MVQAAVNMRPSNPYLARFEEQFEQEGANRLLVKPVGTDELIRQLESMLITHEDSKHKKAKQARAAAAIPRETPKRKARAKALNNASIR